MLLIRRHALRATALAVLLGASFACSSAKSSQPPPTPPAPALWGDMKPVVSVKELMEHMIDPLADNIFDSVGTEIRASGTVDRMPRTDDDWEKIRVGAVTIAEGIYLLKVPRPFTPAGD